MAESRTCLMGIKIVIFSKSGVQRTYCTVTFNLRIIYSGFSFLLYVSIIHLALGTVGKGKQLYRKGLESL